MEARLRQRIARALGVVDEHGTSGPRLVDDAQRLWRRVEAILKLDLIRDPDADALELSCYALQLPMRSPQNLPTGRMGKTNLRDRTEQSAELLVGAAGNDANEELVDRATNILLAIPHRVPEHEESKLLADALNLDDFGIVGFVTRAIQLGRQGDGVSQIADAGHKRDQYGYWEARLKDGFHFEPIRKLARRRLENLREVAKLLDNELNGDIP